MAYGAKKPRGSAWRRDLYNHAMSLTLSFVVLVMLVVVRPALGKSGNVCLSLTDALKDPASDVDETVKAELNRHVFHSHIPKAGASAGSYLRIKGIDSWLECFSECCYPSSNSPGCDVALFTNRKCFHVRCVSSPADACKPVPSPLAKHNSTVMVVLRDLPSDDKSKDEDGGARSSFLSNSLESSKDWDDEKAEEGREDDPNHSVFEPEEGVAGRERAGGKPELPAPSDWLSRKRVGDPCEFGLSECVRNASCVIREDSRSRQGHCQCGDGFRKSSDGSRFCVALKDEVENSISLDSEDDLDNEKEEGKDEDSVETSSKATVTKLTVSAGDQKTIQLPTNSITLTAFVFPKPDEGETYNYEWSVVTLPKNAETATMDGKNTDTLKLSKLIAGLYVLKIKVTGENKFGEALINVTVLPPARQNQPPKAIINPKTQEVNLPNSAILDGSDSTDDDKIVTWKWEEVSGPLQNHELNSDGQMLTLKDMAPGNYTFRLTVTDSDGDTNSTSANVTIKKEKDYPPRADAGSDQVVFLPQNSLDLIGNKSSDDKGQITYEWIKLADDKLTVGMTGVRSPVLHLTNLEAGDYKFTLKVTDSSGQTDTADVHVFVKPQTNKPPVAKTAGHLQVFLPQESLTLDGTNSTDEDGKLTYAWLQTGGPGSLTLTNEDKEVAIATGSIVAGDYEFQLTVTDSSGQQSSDKLTVTVKKDIKLPPKANAGGNKVVELPVSLVTLDGSKSTDDRGIKKYLWERDSKSLAAGTVVNNSDHQAVLQLVNLVAGQYLFTLTVEDAEGLTSKDSASLVVNKNTHNKDTVELILDADINRFTSANKENLKSQLELMLQKPSSDQGTKVTFLDISEDKSTGHLVLSFQVLQQSTVLAGLQALSALKAKLGSGKILDYSIVRLDLTVCQNNCSGHGFCDQKTKQCICEAFWMPNLFSSSVFGTETNCDWSVLYVVIICFIILVSTISIIWAIVCCISSKKCKLKLKSKKRHRYSLLRDADNDSDKDKIEMTSKANKSQNSSVMISESDLSSDEETLFISSSNKRHPNGINGKATANGSKAGSYRTKLKT